MDSTVISERLRQLSELQLNWDGHGSEPPSSILQVMLKDLLDFCLKTQTLPTSFGAAPSAIDMFWSDADRGRLWLSIYQYKDESDSVEMIWNGEGFHQRELKASQRVISEQLKTLVEEYFSK